MTDTYACERVQFPATRNKRLPVLYRYHGTHPLWTRDAYVYEQDTDPDVLRELHDWVDAQEVKESFEEELDAAGWLRLTPGDAVFARKKGATNADEDILQCFVTGRDLFGPAYIAEKLDPIIDAILGDIGQRTADRPQRDDHGELRGGTAFERSEHRARPVKKGARSYQYMGLSTQKPRNLTAPNVNSKLPEDDDRRLRSDMLKTLCSAAVLSFENAPARVKEVARTRSELVNAPKIGTDDNDYFGAFQLNIARASKRDHADSLSTDIGDFGCKHVDGGDHWSGYTNMLILSHLPSDYHPGVFHCHELGAYVRMDNYTGVNFSGLRFHGGKAPTAPIGKTPPAWAYRLTHISYPPAPIIDMSTRQSLASMPDGSTLYITPEMLEHIVPNPTYQVPSRCSNYVTDATGMMTRESEMIFFARNVLRLVQHIASGYPEEYRVHIEPDSFLKSIHYNSDDNQPRDVEPWRFGERIAFMDDKQRQELKEAWDVVDKYTNDCKLFIPSIASRAGRADTKDTYAEIYEARHQVHNTRVDRLEFKVAPEEESDEEEINADGQPPAKKPKPGEPGSAAKEDSDKKGKAGGKRGRKPKNKNYDLPEDADCEPMSECEDDQETGLHPIDGDNGNLMDIDDAPNGAGPLQRESTPMIPARPPTPFELDMSITNLEAIYIDTLRAFERIGSSEKAYNKTACDLLGPRQMLANICCSVRHKPFRDSTVRAVQNTWKALQSSKHEDELSTIQNRILKQHIMLTTGYMWEWLEIECSEALKAYKQQKSDALPEWLQALCSRITTYLLAKSKKSLTLERKNYRPFTDMVSRKTIIDPPSASGPHAKYPTAENTDAVAIQITTDVIADWLDYPPRSSLWHLQGLVTIILLDCTLSTSIFLLDATWDAFLHPKARLLGNRRIKQVTGSHTSTVKASLPTHGIGREDTPEVRVIEQIGAKYVPFGAWIMKTDHDNVAEAANEISAFLLRLRPILNNPDVQDTDSPLLVKAKSNLNLYSPFRDLAPARAQALRPGGPFEDNYMCTRSGLFSGIIYRAITFAAPAIYDDHNNRFSDFQHWSTYLASHSESGRAHICNMAAYGTPNCRRGPDNAEAYWKATAPWEELLKGGFKSFKAVWDFFMSTDEQGHKIFPHLGGLSAFLLATDISYTGVIPTATPMEIGQLIHIIGKGSYKQMIELGLITADSDEEDCSEAYTKLYNALNTALTDEHKQQTKFDVYSPEYNLCKMSRLKAYLNFEAT